MTIATNLVEGDVLIAGDFSPSSTGIDPYLRATGVMGGAYNYYSVGVDGSGNSIISIPNVVIDSKGRIIFARNTDYTITSVNATSSTFGIVKPDNTSVTVSAGVISSTIATTTATSSVLGIAKPDNSTLTISSGILTMSTPIATSSVKGFAKPDNIHIFISGTGVIGVPEASAGVKGIFRPDNITTKIDNSTHTVSLQESTSTKKGIHSVGTSLNLTAGVMSIQDATSSTLGVVKPDNTTITINDGVISANIVYATSSTLGVVKADESTLTVGAGGEISLRNATSTTFSILKGDETTVNVAGGVLSRNTASSSVLGQVRPDNTTIVSGGGVLSASIATGFSGGIARADNVTLSSASGILTVPSASNSILGRVSTDNTTVFIDGAGIISIPTANTTNLGVIRPDSSFAISSGILFVPSATTTELGSVKVDGTGIIITGGVISKTGTVATATSSTFGLVQLNNNDFIINSGFLQARAANSSGADGIVKPDNVTMSIVDGILSVTVARNDSPNNFTQTQTIGAAVTSIAGSVGARFKLSSSFSGGYIYMPNSSGGGLVDGFDSGTCIGAQYILQPREVTAGLLGFTFPATSTNYFGGFKVEGGGIMPLAYNQAIFCEMVVINKGGQPFGLIYNQTSY